MRRDGRRSTNVEDKRGIGGSKGVIGGGIGVIVVVVIALLLGADPSAVLSSVTEQGGYPSDGPVPTATFSAEENEMADFVSIVLADTEDTWNPIFRSQKRNYTEPKLVLFSGGVQSACGYAQSAMGPFYCPADQKVYIDLSFYQSLKDQYGAPGDFAQAYVIAHEVGHHIQNLDGKLSQIQRLQGQTDETTANRLSVMLELQADCYAGLWAHHANRARGVVEPGDIDEALNAASKIGDDTLQKQAQGYVVPDSFTHGSSAQRKQAFMTGYQSGDVAACAICTSDTSCLAAAQ
ncbi:MAG: putative neutral zinc metallopeptidase [Methanoregulaceae archaeon PtaB.Bin108]|nr:MAG: putative neutral zinc metallopeptidase [Methanoregulaceae archaeon PtaB.Bin108]